MQAGGRKGGGTRVLGAGTGWALVVIATNAELGETENCMSDGKGSSGSVWCGNSARQVSHGLLRSRQLGRKKIWPARIPQNSPVWRPSPPTHTHLAVYATCPRYPAVRSELEHCEPLPLRGLPLARSRPPPAEHHPVSNKALLSKME